MITLLINLCLIIDKDSNKPDNLQTVLDLTKKMKRHVRESYPVLVLPGNILYIYQIDSHLKKSCCHTICSTLFCCFDSCQSKNLIDYDSRWASREEFKNILITNRMLLDHFLNQVNDALNYFHSTNRYV